MTSRNDIWGKSHFAVPQGTVTRDNMTSHLFVSSSGPISDVGSRPSFFLVSKLVKISRTSSHMSSFKFSNGNWKLLLYTYML